MFDVAVFRAPHLQVLSLVRKTLPGADVISNVAGHITLGVQRRALPHLPKFITALEDAKATDAQFIEEWGVEGTTLEEVAEAPWSGAEWAVALRFDNPRATVLVLLLSDTSLRVLGFRTPYTPLRTLRMP